MREMLPPDVFTTLRGLYEQSPNVVLQMLNSKSPENWNPWYADGTGLFGVPSSNVTV